MKTRIQIFCLFSSLILFSVSLMAAPTWKPAPGPLMTRWAREVTPENAWREYPRPSLVRKDWQNLNGLWDYAIVPRDAAQPMHFAGKILVPFPIESALSGVMKPIGATNRLWYRRTFTVPKKWKNKQIMLNFGAVDWEARVWVNGKELGSHQGGYDKFSFNITDALKNSGEEELVVAVWDPTDAGPQPRGKQVGKPGGIWYTPVTGIWQTPWLEPVSETSIESIKITPDIDRGLLSVAIKLRGNSSEATIQGIAKEGRREVANAKGRAGETLHLSIPKAKLWSPDSPFLYDLQLTVSSGGKSVDEILSYFGMRKSSMARDEKGTLRLLFNNKPLFQFGPLDQGWWPDGLYTAPSDEALRYDIEMTKQLGFNMARKHVKVEPERWYYWCDKLGLLVWQDMPSGDKSARWRGPSGYDGEEMKRTPESAAIFEKELKELIDEHYNHPSIVVWVPFNEGWGQFETVRILNLTRDLDPTRLVDGASGGNHFPAGHIIDHHQYPGPGAPQRVTDRAMVLGEFGGLGLPLPGHTWQREKNWGYRSFTNSEALTKAYVGLVKKLHPMIGSNELSSAIYTQTTDVEAEVNGLMTYDRALIKMDKNTIAAANKKLYGPPPLAPRVTTLSPAAKEAPVRWRYTMDKPPETWMKEGFDDAEWKEGAAGFGTSMTPNSVVRTEWNTANIWMRRTFEVPANFKASDLQLFIFHDEDAQVYLNGERIAEFAGFVGTYDFVPLDNRAPRALKPGRNTLSVWCKQTVGGQFIDIGLVDVDESRQARSP